MASSIDFYCNSELCRGFNCKSGIGIQLYEGKAFARQRRTQFPLYGNEPGPILIISLCKNGA